jgi:hypothetical protein
MLRAGIAGALLMACLILLSSEGAAQEFRVTFQADRSAPDRTKITGAVVNTGRVDVLDVHVTAEAVDGGGKVVGRGIAFVSPNISQGHSAPFEAVIPVGTAAASFRVRVTSYRLGLGSLQSP